MSEVKNGKYVGGYGSSLWYLNDKSHLEDGPAVEFTDGTKEWYVNGQRHREDGPAIENADGSKAWLLNGDRHREDGPAIEYINGTQEWWLNDTQLTEEEFNQWRMKKELNERLHVTFEPKPTEKRMKI